MKLKETIQKEASKLTKNDVNVPTSYLNKVLEAKYNPTKKINKALAFLKKQQESKGKKDEKNK